MTPGIATDAGIRAKSAMMMLRDCGSLAALVVGHGPPVAAFIGQTLVVSYVRKQMRFGSVAVRPDPSRNPWLEFFAVEDVPREMYEIVQAQKVVDMIVVDDSDAMVGHYPFVYVPWPILWRGSLPAIPKSIDIP